MKPSSEAKQLPADCNDGQQSDVWSHGLRSRTLWPQAPIRGQV